MIYLSHRQLVRFAQRSDYKNDALIREMAEHFRLSEGMMKRRVLEDERLNARLVELGCIEPQSVT